MRFIVPKSLGCRSCRCFHLKVLKDGDTLASCTHPRMEVFHQRLPPDSYLSDAFSE